MLIAYFIWCVNYIIKSLFHVKNNDRKTLTKHVPWKIYFVITYLRQSCHRGLNFHDSKYFFFSWIWYPLLKFAPEMFQILLYKHEFNLLFQLSCPSWYLTLHILHLQDPLSLLLMLLWLKAVVWWCSAKRCSHKFRKIHKKTLVLGVLLLIKLQIKSVSLY